MGEYFRSFFELFQMFMSVSAQNRPKREENAFDQFFLENFTIKRKQINCSVRSVIKVQILFVRVLVVCPELVSVLCFYAYDFQRKLSSCRTLKLKYD